MTLGVSMEYFMSGSLVRLGLGPSISSGRRPLVHQKGEREEGAIIRHNSLSIFLQVCLYFSLLLVSVKFMNCKISAVSSHNFKPHVKIRSSNFVTLKFAIFGS